MIVMRGDLLLQKEVPPHPFQENFILTTLIMGTVKEFSFHYIIFRPMPC